MEDFQILGAVFVVVVLVMLVIGRNKDIKRLELANKFALIVFIITVIFLFVRSLLT